MSWPWKVKVIGQNKWHKLKGFYSSYLVLKFGSVSPLRNWDISRNVILQRSWPWKVKVIGQNKWHRQLPWPQKHRSRHQNLRPKCFSSNVIVKNIFLHNGGQRNTFAYVSRSNRSGCFLICWKAPTQATLVLKFGDNLSSRNRDVAQSVILYSSWPWKVKVIREVNNILHHANSLTLDPWVYVSAQDIIILCDRSRPKLSCVKDLATFCPLITEIWPNVTWFHKGLMTLKGQDLRSKQMAPT